MILDFWKIVEKFNVEETTFNYLVKKGVNSKANKESLIAVYLPEHNYQKIHFYEFPIIKEARWRNGAKTKYEIPQYINDAPEDFPLICTIKEAGSIKNYNNKLKKKEEKLKNNANKENANPKENINDILDEPLPNEMHKYCHLCKKNFDNYIRHINSKIHKDNINKHSDKFNNIKNIFKRINSFWENNKNDKDNNNIKIKKSNVININENFENENFKLKIFSQFNQTIREGCKAKKKIFLGNSSQLSTAQSFPVIPPKKRKKNDCKQGGNKSKDKKYKSNKTINEFLINGEYVNIKKINRENIHFYNNYYY